MDEEIYFTTFYTDTKDVPKRDGKHVLPLTEQLPLFIDFIKKKQPNNKVIVLTDLSSDINYKVDGVIRYEVNYNKIMLERIRIQIEFLKENIGKKIVFLDTDILVLKNCNKIFDNNYFDIGVTKEYQMGINENRLYNNGVIFVNNQNNNAITYFELLYKSNLEMDEKFHAWNGNEYAVNSILGNSDLDHYIKINQTIIKIIDGHQYNFTPKKENEDISEKFILHFKSDSKFLMKHYYNNYIG